MFYSGITVKKLIDSIKDEADIAPVVNDDNYIHWINALEQMLYSEIIKEQGEYMFTVTNSEYDLTKINEDYDAEEQVRFEDIVAVYANIDDENIQLKKSTVATGDILPNCYFKYDNYICFSKGIPDGTEIEIIYNKRPKISTDTSKEIMLPMEFIELMKSKVRGEAYKLANEDALAAKWLNDYNVLLETFKVWVSDKSPSFGI